MKFSKLGWLAAFMALAAVVGAVGFTARPTEAAVTAVAKACNPTATPGVNACTLTVTETAGFAGQTYTVTLANGTGAATFAAVAGGTTNVAGCTVAVAAVTPTTYQFTTVGAACAAALTITLNESVNVTASGTINQTVLAPFSGTSASGAAAVVAGAPTVNTVVKACTIPAVAGQPAGTAVVGTGLACTLTVTFAAAPVAPVAGTIATTGGTTVPAAFSCPAGAAVCVIPETLTPTAAGTIPAETVTIGAQVFGPLAGGVTAVVTGAAAVTIMELATPACTQLTAPTGPVTVGATVDVTAVTNFVCRVNLRETGTLTPELVSSGVVNLTIGQSGTVGTAGTIAVTTVTCGAGSGTSCAINITGATASVRCGAPNTNDTCDFVDVFFTVTPPTQTGLTATGVIGIDGNYTPDNPALNTPANINVPTVFTVRVPAIGVGPRQTILELAGCVRDVVSTTAGLGANPAFLAGGTVIEVTSATEILVGCRINARETGTLTPEIISSGIVTVTIGVPVGLEVAIQAVNCISLVNTSCSATLGGNQTATARCGAQNTNDTCDFIDVFFRVTGPALAGTLGQTGTTITIGLDAAYVPDNPTLNTNANLNIPNLLVIRRIVGVTQCVNPFAIRLTASASVFGTSQPADLLQTLRPGELGGGEFGDVLVNGVGVLPGSVSVTARPVDAAGNVITAVCPGTFEVSSLNGTLLDLSGNVTTNLRIACGQGSGFGINQLASPFGFGNINLNTCAGVTFGVLGFGVGVVDVIVRYEPLNEALCVGGCFEVETRGRVAFVAPVARVILRLDPNPVAVGATTTAIAELQTLYGANCTAINPGQGLANVASSLCIDPATGRVITAFTDPGSRLNGFVVFTVDNTAIARFQEPGLANASTTLNFGVTGTAAQVVRECGAFSGGRNTTNPFSLIATTAASGPLAPYFGGCTEARATLVGVNIGSANVSAAFIPFLPGAATSTLSTFGVNSTTVLGAGLVAGNFFQPGVSNSLSIATLQVAGVAPTGNVELVRGCNNVTPTVSEAASAYAARVTPTAAVIAIWEHQAATNTFRGAPGAASPASAQAVADLSSVTRLRPVFVCVNAPATLAQPPI